MAARSDAAATPGPKNCVFMSVSLVSSSSNCLTLLKNQKTNTRKHIYDRQSLLDIDNVYKHQLSPATTEKLQGLCLLLKPVPETAASPTDATRTKRRRRRCERGQKRGKRGGIRARLRANPTSPAIPSLMLSNVRSLENKLDLIQLSRSTQHETRDCCVFVFTETWLNDNIPDSAIQLHGLTCCRADRDSSLQNGHMALKSIIISQTAEIHGACGKAFRPSLTTSPRHRPVTTTHPSQMHSTTFIHGLKCRTTHLHKNCPHLPTTRHSVCLQPT